MSVENDAVSDGWLCDRGRYNIGFYESPERLTQPLYRRRGELIQIGWDDAFVLWAKAIRDAVSAGEARRVGAIGGGRLTNEEAFLLQHVFRTAGVTNVDWRAGSQRQATPGRGGTLERIDAAQAIVVAGDSLVERAPVLWLRVRKAARAGANVVQASNADEAARAIGDASRVALIWDGVDVAVGRQYAEAFAHIGDLSTYVASEQANARGAELMGMLPGSGPGFVTAADGLDSQAMFEAAASKELTVLSIFGANPARNAPGGVAVGEALAGVDFLVVSELFMTETAQRATLVLPAKGAFEKNGTTLNLAGDLLPVNASLQAPESVRSDYEILAGLAEELGVDVPSPEALHATIVRCAAQTQDFTFGDARFGNRRAASGLEVQRDPQNILSGGGTWQHDSWLAGMRA